MDTEERAMTDLDLGADLYRIERHVDIDAPAERVWGLLEHPGWWINEGEVDLARAEVRDEGDGTHVLVHPEWGEFRIRTEESRPPRYLAYRWLDRESSGGTLVEFTVEDRADGGGVTLRVVESGFETLGGDREVTARKVAENTGGWITELAAARAYVDAAAG
jgi:uncharacterized protein YndB with AHSA1/START domain